MVGRSKLVIFMGQILNSIAVFSSRKNLGSGTVTHFVVIRQLMSNRRLIRLKRFISYETVKLYN